MVPGRDYHWDSLATAGLGDISGKPRGASLVDILSSLLSQLARVAPCKGHLSQAHCHLGLTVPPAAIPEVTSGSIISGNIRILIIQMSIGQNMEHRQIVSSLCHLLIHL